MKKLIIICACMAACSAIFAQTEDPCGNCYSLTGTISSNTTLNQTCYHLTGCVNVTSGHTLTINAGTKVFAASGASLVIERGAYLIAQGTSSSPIVFTTDQAVSSRAPGYWKGITVAGNATDNQSGFTLDRNCVNISCGGSNDLDSSGVLEYVQIHYAGGQATGEDEVNGLTLASVGSKTVLDHVQVAYSAQEGFAFLGGTVNGKYLVAYNNYGNDVKTDRGYRGLMQYGLLVRLDAAAHRSGLPFSNGIYSINDDAHSANSIKTAPVFSNFSIIGPAYCGATGLSSDFKNGVLFADNTEARVYNSLIAGWPTGFFIQDLLTIQNANDNGTLFFADNSLYNNSTDYSNNPSWTGTGCEASMQDWMNIGNVSFNTCAMLDNQSFSSGLGYSSSICNNYCSSAPTFTVSSSSMSSPDYSTYNDVQSSFFDAATYRGAIQSTDWTSGWTEFCPQSVDYCSEARPSAPAKTNGLLLQPNPAHNTTYAVFNAAEGLQLHLEVLDKVTGKVLQNIAYRTTYGGQQKVAVPLEGLRHGTYVVQLRFPDGTPLSSILLIE